MGWRGANNLEAEEALSDHVVAEYNSLEPPHYHTTTLQTTLTTYLGWHGANNLAVEEALSDAVAE